MKPENIKRTLIFAYITMGSAQVFELLFNYFLYLLIPVAEIGIYSWAAALLVFFNVVVDMGIEPILVRRFGHKEFSFLTAFRAIFLLRAPLIALGALLLAILYVLGALTSNEYWILQLVGAHVVFNVFDGVSRAWLRANSQQTVANFIACLQSGLKLVTIITLYFLSQGSIYYVLIFLLLIRLLGSFLFIMYANKMQHSQQTRLDGHLNLLPTAWNLLRSGLSVGGIALLTAAQNRLDWLLISGLLSATALASYALANKLYEITQVVIGVSLTTLYPWLCRRDDQGEFRLLLLLRMIVFAGALISVVGILLTPLLIDWLFGNKYLDVRLPAQLMMLSTGMIAVSGVFYQVSLAKGLEKTLLTITVITTTLQLLANLYLIPKLGISGGAIGMLVLQLVTVAGLTVVVLKNKLVVSSVVMRVMAFMTLFITLDVLIIYLNVPVWYALPVGGLTILVAGSLVLFRHDERRYITTNFHTIAEAVKKPFISKANAY